MYIILGSQCDLYCLNRIYLEINNKPIYTMKCIVCGHKYSFRDLSNRKRIHIPERAYELILWTCL